MSLCANCGIETFGDLPICSHHHVFLEDDFGRVNRMGCDFFHRGVEPPAVPTPTDLLEKIMDWPPTPPSPPIWNVDAS